MDFPQFMANRSFLKFLSDVASSPDLRESLTRTDFSSIVTAPGLSEQERNFLKVINWSNFEIRVDPNLEPVLTEGAEVCERKVDRNYAERGCWKN